MERPGGNLLKAGVSSVAGMGSITAISKQMGQSLATMDLQNQVLLLLLLLCLSAETPQRRMQMERTHSLLSSWAQLSPLSFSVGFTLRSLVK